MARIDIKQLSESVSNQPEPYNFHLYLTVMNNGKISDTNPFKNDRNFLSVLIDHYEAEENYEVCVDLIRRKKALS